MTDVTVTSLSASLLYKWGHRSSMPYHIKPKKYCINLTSGVNFQVTFKQQCAKRNHVKGDLPLLPLRNICIKAVNQLVVSQSFDIKWQMGINILPPKLQPPYYTVKNNHNAYIKLM